jgi:CheY-like chemotaxis protein
MECVSNTTPEATVGRDLGVSLNPWSFLIVEDNATNALVMKLLIEKSGGTTEHATNGLQCLTRLQNQTFDLILMDIQMPVMNGLETIQHIRSGDSGILDSARTTPILAVSAYSDKDDIATILRSGADGFVMKPFVSEKLFDAILKLLHPNKLVGE